MNEAERNAGSEKEFLWYLPLRPVEGIDPDGGWSMVMRVREASNSAKIGIQKDAGV